MVQLLNPYSLSVHELQNRLNSFEDKAESLLISKKSADELNLDSLMHLLDEDPLLWLSSSGSFQKKLIGLSKKALVSSAAAVNSFLGIHSDDCWAIALPLQHIASVSVFFRSILSKCSIRHFEKRWNAAEFSSFINDSQPTVCSLVPTQIYDLVKSSLKPNPQMRIVLAGGARLESSIYKEARKLGWPILPTYGLTECASQVACAAPESLDSDTEPELKLLPHLKALIAADGCLEISGSSLPGRIIDINDSGKTNLTVFESGSALKTSDLAEINGHHLKILGRSDRFIKIKGSLIQLQRYEELLGNFCSLSGHNLKMSASTTVPDLRDGAKVVICCDLKETGAQDLLKDFNEYIKHEDSSLPAAAGIIKITEFPLLENGKINYSEIKKIAEQSI